MGQMGQLSVVHKYIFKDFMVYVMDKIKKNANQSIK